MSRLPARRATGSRRSPPRLAGSLSARGLSRDRLPANVYEVQGTVRVTAQGSKESITIIWVVLAPDGTQLGVTRQTKECAKARSTRNGAPPPTPPPRRGTTSSSSFRIRRRARALKFVGPRTHLSAARKVETKANQ